MAIARPLYGPGPEESSPLRPARDLEGTAVADAAGRYIGTVFGVLADAQSGLIRYLDLALEGSDRHILVPLGHTRVTRLAGRTEIELRGATGAELSEIPPYEPSEEGPDGTYERATLAAHGRLFHGERYYAHPAYDHRGLYAGEHPIIRGEPLPEAEGPLHQLTELPGYRVAEGESDIRGWPLIDRRGQRVGSIEDLLVDTTAEKVRYALVHLEDPGITAEGRLVPIPAGYLQLDGQEEVVRVPALGCEDLLAIPGYLPTRFDRAFEEKVLAAIEARLAGERRFDRPDFAGDHEVHDQRSEL